jgi:hypothetical protein
VAQYESRNSTRSVLTLLPERLTGIDETNRSSYYFLEEGDRCFFFGEFHIGRGWSGGPTNQLISNYKRTPGEIAASPNGTKLQYYKDRAIAEIAAGLRRQFSREDVQSRYTFVPVPGSRVAGDPDHCDRLERTLRAACELIPGADIRPLLRLARSIPPDHRSGGARIKYDELLAVTEVDQAQLANPIRNEIVLFDDVLTSGKHYKVAKARIRETLPHVPILAVFVARAIHPNPFENVDLE